MTIPVGSGNGNGSSTGPSITSSTGAGARAEVRTTDDEIVIRIPTPARLLRTVFPDEAVTHMQAAWREQLLALRTIVDAAVQEMDRRNAGGSSRTIVRRTEIHVE